MSAAVGATSPATSGGGLTADGSSSIPLSAEQVSVGSSSVGSAFARSASGDAASSGVTSAATTGDSRGTMRGGDWGANDGALASGNSADRRRQLEPPRATWSEMFSRVGLVLVLIVVLAGTYRGAEIRPVELVRNSGNMVSYLRGFFPPDFGDGRLFLQEMWITLQIAIWGTFLAVILAVPCSLLSAANVSPWWLRQPMRRLMDAFRAINEMIFAMLFVSAVGLGPFAGVLALAVHTLGTLSKLFSEAVEAVDSRPVEGIRAVGASWFDEIVSGILPQVMPLWISYTLYRFEANVRSASVVGMVGAGGIGMLLWDAIRSFDYGRTAAMLIIVIINVTLIDLGSSSVRKRFV